MAQNVFFTLGGDAVSIIDQTLLPAEERVIELRTPEECRDAISRLAVRGAPAIGIFAAHALAMLAQKIPPEATREEFFRRLAGLRGYLVQARPTAVNLAWAADRAVARAHAACPPEGEWNAYARYTVEAALRAEALAIQQEDAAACRAMAEAALSLVEDGWGVVTHCNAGPLATSEYGTALGPILLGRERGVNLRVFADETRPLLQGARLTAYELERAGVDVTLICDNMAASVMAKGWVQACFVGADRIAANGDVANKIGTLPLAIVAAHYGVPFYVVAPESTLDASCATGADIPIELRDGSEIAELHYARRMAPEGVPAYNPSFDVTPAALVSAIITETGIHRPPYRFG